MKQLVLFIGLACTGIACSKKITEEPSPIEKQINVDLTKNYYLKNLENTFINKYKTVLFNLETTKLSEKSHLLSAKTICDEKIFEFSILQTSDSTFSITPFLFQNQSFTGKGFVAEKQLKFTLEDKETNKYEFISVINKPNPLILSYNKQSLKTVDTLNVIGQNLVNAAKQEVKLEGYETNTISSSDTLLRIAIKKKQDQNIKTILNITYDNCFVAKSSDTLIALTDTWKYNSSLPGPSRWYSIALSMGKYVYLGTGINDDRKRLSDFYRFDPSNNSWKQMASFIGGARNSGVAFAIGDTAYLGTGHNGDESVSNFFKYVGSEDKWYEMNEFPGQEREHGIGFTIGNKGYVALGKNKSGYLNDLWEYDPVKNKWTQKKSKPGEGTGFSFVFVYKNKAYFGPGLNKSSVFIPDFWEYDASTNTYKSMPPLLAIEPEYFQIGKYGYVVHEKGRKMSRFDLEKHEWEHLTAPYNYLVIHGVGFSHGNKGYHGTGFSGIYSNIFFEYTP